MEKTLGFTCYSYDIHGNVKTLMQDNKRLLSGAEAIASQRFKRIDYDYHLISEKVNMVLYQKDSLDAFYHYYNYDAHNHLFLLMK
ncbi:MAG: hypothetical protein HGB12_16915 [Bacteroidetes bacterium]|nr:hypothetical protein [Bacteroidota bacterium]